MQLTQEELYASRSEEVQEILSKPPTFLMRWGIPMLLFIFLGTVVLAHFTCYPDTVVASALLTSNPPPVRLMTKSTGYLRLLVADGAWVEADVPLAYIQNPANLEAVLSLEKNLIKTPLTPAIATPNSPLGQGALGELQPYYDVLVAGCAEWKIRTTYPIQQEVQKSLASQLWREKVKVKNLQAQDKLTHEAFEQSYKNYRIDSLLYTQKVKTPVEFNQSQGEFLRQKQTLKSSEATILSQNAQIASMREKLQELRLQASEQDAKLLLTIENAYRNLATQLALWKHRYLITSPSAGKVHFLQYWTDNQYIGAEQEVMTILPESPSQEKNSPLGQGALRYLVQLRIPSQGAGKIQVGQQIWIELTDFPAQEYGKLQGKIIRFTPILQLEKGKEDKGQYIAVAELASLQTDYHKTLTFKPEMQGQAHIITVPRSLLERMLQPLQKNWSKT